ncbi:MAG: hypothetical protein AB7F78_02340 [Hyphomicrobiaceae bacterium]
MRLASLAALAVLLAVAAGHDAAVAASPGGLAVEVTNASEPVLCAEKDNVTLAFSSVEARSFRIEAAHPAYIGALARDSFEADWTACDMSKDPVHASAVKAPTRRTLYEEPALWVVGWTMPTFWRPSTAKVRIGEQSFEGLHLVQVWMIRPMGGEEVLVFYPQDGYWRIRPLAPEGRAPTAFGTSFLVGPVETDIRPIVKLREVAFDPQAKRFTLAFEQGGSATLTLAEVTRDRHTLDIAFDRAITGRPFAMLRSMYVTEFNNDVARVAVREAGAQGWREGAIMGFHGGKATDVWAGRTSVSRHNTSSPDMVLSHFSVDPPAAGAPAAGK